MYLYIYIYMYVLFRSVATFLPREPPETVISRIYRTLALLASDHLCIKAAVTLFRGKTGIPSTILSARSFFVRARTYI